MHHCQSSWRGVAPVVFVTVMVYVRPESTSTLARVAAEELLLVGGFMRYVKNLPGGTQRLGQSYRGNYP